MAVSMLRLDAAHGEGLAGDKIRGIVGVFEAQTHAVGARGPKSGHPPQRNLPGERVECAIASHDEMPAVLAPHRGGDVDALPARRLPLDDEAVALEQDVAA